MDFSDERLITITTQELKALLNKGVISREKHNELRSRRRRLQNRKYARKCARKKQVEVSYLHTEIDKERSEISALRKQQAHLTDVTERYDAQRRKLVKLADNASSGFQPILMVGHDGVQREVFLAPEIDSANSRLESTSSRMGQSSVLSASGGSSSNFLQHQRTGRRGHQHGVQMLST